MECHLSASPDPQPGHPGTWHDAQNSVGQELGFPGGAGGKEPSANANTGGRTATHIILSWETPWTEEPARLHPWGCEESDQEHMKHAE